MNRVTSPRAPRQIQSNAFTLPRQAAVLGNRLSMDCSPLEYQLLAPIHYEANYAYPLLVWLHSEGDDERQLLRVMPHVSLRNYVSVAPRGVTTQSCGYSYRWSDDLASPEAAWRGVQQAIEIARQRHNVNIENVFLAGFGDGGTMALRLALGGPEQFAGVVSIGGPFPQNCAALSRLNTVRDLPLLIMRGLESHDYTEKQMCDEIRLFHAARLQVHLRQYTCGDDLIVPMLRDLDAWIMEQVTGMPVLAESDAAV